MLLSGLRSPSSATKKSQRGKQQQQQQQHKREDSWEKLRSPSDDFGPELNGDLQRNGSHNFASPPSMYGTNNKGNSLYPLQSTADRVGREVERFAEKLDRWNNFRDGSAAERYEATITLVDDLQKVTGSAVARLRKQHAAFDRQHGHHQDSQRRLNQSRVNGDDGFGHNRSFLDSIANAQGQKGVHATGIISELRQWQSEHDTWELFRLLLGQRYHRPGVDIEKEKEAFLTDLGDVDMYTSEADMWKRFLIDDDEAKERSIVCKWLQEIANHTDGPTDAIIDKLESEAGKGPGTWSHGWLNTREKLKGQKRVGIFTHNSASAKGSHTKSKQDDGTDLVTALDPDAITRQGRQLDKRDQALERSLWVALYAMLRRGANLEQVLEWSRERSEGWRALSLGCGASAGAQNNMGVVNSTALWRRMCLAAARSGGVDDFERAVYGMLGGDIDSVEAVCRSWDDLLYAHFNSLNLTQYDLYVQNNFSFRLPSHFARKFEAYTGSSLSAQISLEEPNKRVVDLLRKHDISKSEAEHPLKMIQASIIENKFEDIVFGLGVAISQISHPMEPASKTIPRIDHPVDRRIAAMAEDYNALRIVVHALLVLQVFDFDMGAGDLRTIHENVLVKYIGFLQTEGKFDIIPMYASMLSKDRCEITLGRILPYVANGKERIDITRLMEQYKIDSVSVLTEQQTFAFAESSLRDEDDEGEQKVPAIPHFELLEDVDDEAKWPRYRIRKDFVKAGLAADEDAIVKSLEWYLLLQGQWMVTFAAISYTYKRFFQDGRVAAAIMLSRRFSCRKVSFSKTPLVFGREVDVMDDHEGSGDEAAPALRRSTRASVRKRSVSASGRTLSPEHAKVHRDLLKQQSRTAYELEQLAHAIYTLHQWRQAEAIFYARNFNVPQQRSEEEMDAKSEALDNTRRLYDDVREAVEPLLHDFLTHPMNDHEARYLEAVRNAYLPDIILAYNSVIYSAAYILSSSSTVNLINSISTSGTTSNSTSASSSTSFSSLSSSHLNALQDCIHIESMDLATTVAADENCVSQTFTRTGRMHELVESLALSSKALLRYQEDLLAAATAASSGGRARGPGGKGRGRVASGGGKAGGLRKGFSAGGNAGAGNGRRRSRGKSVGIWNLGAVN